VTLAGVAVGLVAAFGGRSPAKPLTGAAETRTLLAGLQQHENVLGSPSAPVTLVEYADLQCPYCRNFDEQSMPALITRYVRAGKLKVVFRPLAFIGADSARGRNAVIAAGLQGKLFDVVRLLYANQRTENTGWLDDRLVKDVAASIPGLDVEQLVTDAGSAAVVRRAQGLDSAASADGIRSTPTLLVGTSGGPLHRVDEGNLAAAIAAAL
jgi:protein-disulfide isomerase